jgi:hypothetical protein
VSFLRAIFSRTVLLVLLAAVPARAQDDTVVVVIAKWVTTDKGDVLVIPFSDALTEKQKNMITGGFTTVSQLSVRLPGLNEGSSPDAEVFNARCSVKFDAWEETYEIVKVELDGSKPDLTKNFGDYAAACLTGDITDREIVRKFTTHGGLLLAQLTVKQTSAEEATRIKEWLIQQQSGVMQSLFSHMLGDIALHQTHVVNIQVPPKPALLQPAQEPSPGKKTAPANGKTKDKGKG